MILHCEGVFSHCTSVFFLQKGIGFSFVEGNIEKLGVINWLDSMAQHSNHGSWSPAAIRFVIVLVGVCLVGYVIGPPLYWNLAERFGRHASCPPCVCDCSSKSVISMPLGKP